MFHCRTIVPTLLATLLQIFALADGGASGGGGKGVLCTSQDGQTNLELLEQYEARKLNIKLPKAVGSLTKEIELHGHTLSDYFDVGTSPTSQEDIMKGLNDFLTNYFLDQKNLPLTLDTRIKVPIDPNCQLVQIAINVNDQVFGKSAHAKIRVYRDPDYWKQLDSFGQYLLINHEFLSFTDRLFDPPTGKKNVNRSTDIVRDFLIKLYSGQIKTRRDGRPLVQKPEHQKIRSRLSCENTGGQRFFVYEGNMSGYNNAVSGLKYAITSLGRDAYLWIPSLIKPSEFLSSGHNSSELLYYALFSGGKLKLDENETDDFLSLTLPHYLFRHEVSGEIPFELPLDFDGVSTFPFKLQFKLVPKQEGDNKNLILLSRIITAYPTKDLLSPFDMDFLPLKCVTEYL
jgi:hypothetical protein